MQPPLPPENIRHAPAAPGPVASFLRFVGCGGGIGVLSGAAVPALALLMPWAVSNALITLASTVLCTELHARFTFGTGRRPGVREHWRSAGSATAAYLATCAAMLVLHEVRSSPSLPTEQIVYLSACGLAGVGRFLVLRLFVFAERGDQRARPAATRAYDLVHPVARPATDVVTAPKGVNRTCAWRTCSSPPSSSAVVPDPVSAGHPLGDATPAARPTSLAPPHAALYLAQLETSSRTYGSSAQLERAGPVLAAVLA